MKDASHTTCPECGTRLEAGFISYGSGLVWHKTKLHRSFSNIHPCTKKNKKILFFSTYYIDDTNI